ncbi:MAG: porin family protein [Rhodoferax sp.]|nr:porin family protein [Rhodoferax sp.]
MFARKLKPLAATLLLAGLAGAGAHAEGLYGGGAVGGQTYPDTLNGNPSSGSNLSGKIFGGYQLNPNFAVEAGVSDMGTLNSGSGHVHSYGTFVDAVGIAPLSPQWSLLGRLGVAHMAVDTPTGNDTGNGFKVGLGAEYALTKSVALRGEWERYELVSFGSRPVADQFTLGVKYGF